jgi:hypothetical protein
MQQAARGTRNKRMDMTHDYNSLDEVNVFQTEDALWYDDGMM